MNDLNEFPKRLLVVSTALIVVFVALVSVTFFYHPVIPFPCKIAMTIGEKLPAGRDAFYVQVTGASSLQLNKEYKVKLFIQGESYFSTLTTKDVPLNGGGSLAGVLSGMPKVKKADQLEGVAYKDSLSPLPLIRLMLK